MTMYQQNSKYTAGAGVSVQVPSSFPSCHAKIVGSSLYLYVSIESRELRYFSNGIHAIQ
jgi:hypothetical protein